MPLSPSDVMYYLHQPSFKRWVLYGDTEGEAYWLQWLQLNPQYRETLFQAKELLQAMHSENKTQDADTLADRIEVWDKIQATVKYLEQDNTPIPTLQKRKWRRYLPYAAACIVMVLGLAVWQYLPHEKSYNIAAAKNILPGGEHAILKLPDGRQISLDTAKDGILLAEGSKKILTKNSNSLYFYSGATNITETDFTLSTPKGGRYHVVLADGSQVWMNAASSIHIPQNFSEKNRRVSMQGECYFDVMHMPQHPFSVQNPANTIQVLGTAFNVTAYEKQSAKIALVRGKINIVTPNKKTRILPGQTAVCNPEKSQIDIDANEANIEPATAWKDGYFSFKNENIQQVMDRLSKWYKIEVEYVEPIEDKFFGRIPMSEPLDKVLQILQLAGNVQFKINGNKISIYKQ